MFSKKEITPDQIKTLEKVIHPALDWVNGELIVGVLLKDASRAVLSSARGLVQTSEVGIPCGKPAEKFESSVTPEVAKRHEDVLRGAATITAASGRALLKRILAHLERFIVFPSEWASSVVAAWILGTYLYPAFQTYPYIRLTSETPGCGKTVLGQLIAHLGFNGELLTAPNEAHLFRLCELNRGVQVWDEIETDGEANRKRFESIKHIMLQGYYNGGAVPRQTAKDYDVTERFHLFCPRVFIGLSQLPPVAAQRTICLQMRKCETDGYAEHYIAGDHKEIEAQLREDCISWALCSAKQVAEAYRKTELRNAVIDAVADVGRQSDDIWLPLFAVATTAVDSMNIKRDLFLKHLTQAIKALRPRVSSAASIPQEDDPGDESQHAEENYVVLKTALGTLKWAAPIEPEQLAKQLSKGLETSVHVQKLTKLLKTIGIKSEKKHGRRAYEPTPAQLKTAQERLGRLWTSGQEGQQGQQITVI